MMNQQCKVCGEPAAGFHFGAFTCEGCKSFFGRTYNNMSSISECKNNSDCIINKKNRTSCKSCRLRKCLLVGMSKSGSRYGRRSNWFKIHCLLQEQGSSMNAQNGSNQMMVPNAVSLYPGLFHSTHMLNSEKFLENRLNNFSPFSDSKTHLNDMEKYRSWSEDSGGSSVSDLDDESRKYSTASRGLPQSHQTPSPFSEREFYQKKLSISLPSSPSNTATPSPFALPLNQRVYTSPFVSPTLRPLPPHLPSVSVTRPGITPTTNLVFVDTLASFGWPTRSGGDLLLSSPAPGGVVLEQDQPIDLSLKSCIHDSPRNNSRLPSAAIDHHVADEKELKSVANLPLDLTGKRHQQLTTHSS